MAMNIRLDSQIESYCPGMSIGGNESAFIDCEPLPSTPADSDNMAWIEIAS